MQHLMEQRRMIGLLLTFVVVCLKFGQGTLEVLEFIRSVPSSLIRVRPLKIYLLHLNMDVHSGLDPQNQPVRQTVHYRPQPRELHQHIRGFTSRVHTFMERLPKIRRIKVVVRLCEAELGYDITRESGPGTMEGEDTVRSNIPLDLGCEFIQFSANDRLEIHDLSFREERRDGISEDAMVFMRRCREERLICPEPGGKRTVFVQFPGFHIQFLKVVRVNDVQLVRGDSNDGPCCELAGTNAPCLTQDKTNHISCEDPECER